MFVDALELRNRYGLMSEDVHPATGKLWGNFPQTYSMVGIDPERNPAVAKLGGPVLARLVVVSNRVAVPDGKPAGVPAGSKSPFRPALRSSGGVWFGWSGTRRRRRQPRETNTIEHDNIDYVDIDLGADDYKEYYNGFANRVLWPILHYRLRSRRIHAPRSRPAICASTSISPRELDKLLQPDDVIWVHDYHLIPLAKALRERGHNNRIGFFLHIPFPPPEVLTALPNHERLIPTLVPLRSGRLPDRATMPPISRATSRTSAGCPGRGNSFALRRSRGARSARFRSASRPSISHGSRAAPSKSQFRAERGRTACPAAP